MNTIRKSLILTAILALPLLFASCDSEPAVGTTLFPENTEGNAVKAYIDNRCFYPKNQITTKVVQTIDGSKMFLDGEKVELRVQLTNPSFEDLTFKMKVNNPETEEEKETLLGEDAISFINNTVTVRKGEIESSEMITFTLNKDSESLKAFKEKGMISLSLVSDNGVEISDNYKTYVWNVTKEVTNINTEGTAKGLEMISFDDYEVLDPYYGSPTEALGDNSDDFWGGGIIRLPYDNEKIALKINMKKENEVSAISFQALNVDMSWATNPKKLEILAGDDPNQLERVGFAINPKMPTSPEYWDIVFFSPIKAKHIVIIGREAFGGQIILISEMRLYK